MTEIRGFELPLSPRSAGGRPDARAVLALAGVLAFGVLVAAALVAGLDRTDLPVGLLLLGGFALVGYATLILLRFEAAVAIAIALTAVVLVEPAPTDGAFLLILAVAVASGRMRLSRAPGAVRLFIAVLLAMNLVSMIDAFDLAIALRFSFITVYLAVLALWLATWITSEQRARLVLLAWLVGGLVSAVLGIVAFTLPVPFKDVLLGDGVSRSRALFKDPNVYGPYLVPLAVILLEQRIRPRLLHWRGTTSAAVIVVLTLGILFSFSRASWLNYLLAVAIMLTASAFTRRGGTRAIRTLVSLVAVAVVVGGVLGATGSLDFLQQRAKVQTYDTERFGAQHAGYEIGWKYPVGVGPGQFQFHHPVETHSTYVRVLAEQGFGGLLAWIALVVTTVLLALRNTLRGIDSYGIGAPALLGAWCGLVLNSAVVDTLHWRHLWLVAALIWVGTIRDRSFAQARRAPGRSPQSVTASVPGGTPK